MLFSSITFLFYFLPILLIVYFIVPNKFKNLVLLVFSLIFYAYGEPIYVLILLLSCLVNFVAGLLIEKFPSKGKLILVLTIVYNVGQLIYFKYTDFFIANLNNIFNLSVPLLRIVMPIGISFFTFQTLSYVIDVYRKDVEASHNFLNFATYVSLFPQLVAGPIVRYKTVEEELKKREITWSGVAKGLFRFAIGLGKKVLIANLAGELVTNLTGLANGSVVASILTAVAFTLQIYFDFSGYSDMAIGLGMVFGFHFKENFNYPFTATSITDFWRRWHMSLSSFFRDYVYIPLGGSRVSWIKWLRNILIVWFLTGFWHGAAWNFIVWGLFFAVLLILEKKVYGKYLDKCGVFRYIYTIFFVVISFVIFQANSLGDAFYNLKSIFGFNGLPFINQETIYYLRSYGVLLIVAILGSTPLLKNLVNKIKEKQGTGLKVMNIVQPALCLVLLVVVTAYLIDSSFNPFLYFRF